VAVFVGTELGARDRLEAIAVQASLVAAGSLAPDVMRRIARRPALARRYLAVEGQRALAAIRHVLPPTVQPLVDRGGAARTDSPARSLEVALAREPLADPPAVFGEIRARAVLAAHARAESAAARPAHALHETAIPEDESEDGADPFESPIGGNGALGRWLARMLEPVRRLRGAGPPGGDTPTYTAHAGRSGGARSAMATTKRETLETPAFGARGARYPEWDVHAHRYLPDWCTVQEIEAPPAATAPPRTAHAHGLRRPLARLGMGLDRHHRRAQGDDIDIDAAVEARVDVAAGASPAEAVYVESLRRRRDLSVLVLLDVSGSAAEPGSAGAAVHEHQRAAAAALTSALHEIGDRVALYAYQSRGRSAVQLAPVKRFDEPVDALALRRLHGLVPCAYSRLGAAIRHGAAVLEERGGTSRRLLVVLSDGLAYDHGYEPDYGAADARRALAEARRRGTGSVWLSIGAATDDATLRRVFGSAAHAALPRIEPLRHVIGLLFRAALRSAEVRQRPSSGARTSRLTARGANG
jgi:nitric oxide reductase NorD protein